MKKILGNGLRFLILALVITTTFLIADTQANVGEANSVTDSVNTKLNKLDVTELMYFNIAEFTNISHLIDVDRTITANQFGYTSSRTEIRISTNNSQDINALNYTLPTMEYNSSKYFRIYSENDTLAENTSYDVYIRNETTDIVIKFPTISSEETLTAIIEMDHPNAITYDENDELVEGEYPYHFNLSFLPLLTIPITSYNLEWRVGTDIGINIDNDTLEPTKANFIGDISLEGTALHFEDIQELNSINRDLLNQSKYGGYNLTALEERNFIPSYNINLAQNLTDTLTFDYYQVAGTFLTFTSLVTTIEVSEWGTVYTKQTINLKNIGLQSGPVLSTAIGGTTFPTLSFDVPDSAAKIGIKDNYGNVTPLVNANPITEKISVEFKPRIQIEQGAEYQIVLSFTQSSKNVINNLGGGKVELLTDLSSSFNCTVQKFELELLFPFGSSITRTKIRDAAYKSSLRSPVSITAIQKTQFLGLFNSRGYRFSFEELTPLSNKQVQIEFGLSPLHQLYTPLTFSIFFLIVGLVYAVIRNLLFGYKPSKLVLEEIPLDMIKSFVKSYEEKTAIREQILRLDRKRKSKNISAREYEQTKIILRNQQQQNDRTIVSVSRKLAEENPRIRLSMRSIEVAEASREDYLKNIESLEKKKSQGRIGKEAYAKLKIDYDNKLRKANNEIDKVLIELRNLLTK
ncbi:MAG: hypothetical protein ACW98F_14165 [Candidatus Hodarchaeales archaeon]|jgi:hypothetical protein